MSWQALRWVASLPKYKKLSTADWLVLTWLASHHHQHTGRTDPSEEMLARETHLSARTVGRAKRRLAAAGLIEIQRQYKGRGRGRKSDQMNLLGKDPEDGAPLARFQDLDEQPSARSSDLREQVTGRNDLPDNQDRPTRTPFPRTQRTQEAAATKEEVVRKEEVQAVFDSWAQSLQDGTAPRLTPRRAALIARSLEHSTLDELVRAVKSWPHTDYHSGRKYGKGPENRLDQVLKDRESVEQLNNAGLVREKQELVVLDDLALDRYEKLYSQLTEAERAEVRKRRQEDSW